VEFLKLETMFEDSV